MSAKILAIVVALFYLQPVLAGQDEASAALAEILFDSEIENVSYVVSSRGDVDIVFGVSVPEDQFVEVTGKLKASSDIRSVLSSRGMSDFCRQVVR